MPCNIQHAPISDIKLGINTVSKAYIGHEQAYPNQRVLTNAVYTDTSTVSSSGGTRYLRVTGEEGSQYALAGAISGNFSLGPSYTDHSVGIGGQGCGSSSRTVGSITLTPISPTVISGGASSISRSLTQAAGEPITNWSATWSWSITNTNKVTVVQNGVTKWAQGSTWTVNITSNALPTSVSNFYVNTYFTFGVYTSMTPNQSKIWQRALDGNSYNMTWTVTQGSTPVVSHSPYLDYSTGGCYRINNATSGTTYGGTLYP